MKDNLNNNKTAVIQKNGEYLEIENLINSMVEDLDSIKATCEDRNSEHFPIISVTELVKKCEKIKLKGKNVKVSDTFKRHVLANKEIHDYFESAINKADDNERQYLKKMEIFKTFASVLEERLFK